MNTSITTVELYKLKVPLKEPFVISLETIEFTDNVIVKVVTEGGITGFGEASPFRTIHGETQESCFEIGKVLARQLRGKNALATEDLLAGIDAAIAGNHCIKSAFDMALYDIAAQVAGLPLYAFLGGSQSQKIITNMTVSIGSPEKMADAARGFCDDGFRTIKVKLGTTADADIARIRAIREAVGPEVKLRVDANQGWDLVTARRTLDGIADYRIDYCEEPVRNWHYAELPRLRQHSPIPLMADESLFDHRDAFKLARLGAVDYFNIKVGKAGGLRNSLLIAGIGEAAGIDCQLGCFTETRLGITAAAHLALARRNIRFYDLDSSLLLASDPVEGGATVGTDGAITVDDKPGLGARLAQGVLDKMEKAVI